MLVSRETSMDENIAWRIRAHWQSLDLVNVICKVLT